MKKAIEVEYWVINRAGELSTPGDLAEISEYVEPEFVDPLIELKTPPCDSYAELHTTFLEQLEQLLSAADERGKMLVPLGTPIHAGSINQRSDPRTEIQHAVVGEELNYANHCAGTHLHFEQRNVTDQLNVLIALDPALALLNSSPYFEGKRVANGARSYLYRKKCYESFPKHGQLWEYVETVAEWKERLGECYEEFETAAREAGVSKAEVEANFSPDSVVWTPIRLRDAMPTVEWRSPDVTLPSQILRLVDDLDTIMTHINEAVVSIEGERGRVEPHKITIPTFEAVREYTDEAIHHGTESPAVSSYLERMGFDLSRYNPLTQDLTRHGYVDTAGACQLRRSYAKRLQQDVDMMLNTQPV